MRKYKLTPTLQTMLQTAAAGAVLDIVLGLAVDRAFVRTLEGSRKEKAHAMRMAFDEEVRSIERVISRAGGKVTDRAWVNKTLRAEVRPEVIRELSGMDEVEVLDVPPSIWAEAQLEQAV